MNVPLELSFRNVEDRESLTQVIQQQVNKLQRVCRYISSCRVAVERTQEHQRSGNPYRVRIDITVPPSHEFVIKREPSKGNLHDPLILVIHDAFDAARRKIKEQANKQRYDIKSHPQQDVQGIVSKLFKEEGYGFIRSTDGREIYFHEHGVLHNRFDRLEIGTGVTFFEHTGEDGPQASSVKIIDKPGARLKTVSDPALKTELK